MSNLRYDKKFKLLMLSLMVVMLLSFQFGTVLAATANNYTSTLNQGDTLEGTGFFSGETVRVNGNVNGPTFVSGGNIEVNGDIDGDLFVAGQTITVTGNVTGSLFVAGQDINIGGKINNGIYSAGANVNVASENNGSVFLAGQNIFTKNEAKIGRDLFIGGSKVTADGTIGGDVNASGDNVSLFGSVGKNANLDGPILSLDSADVKGDLVYTSQNEAKVSEDSTVGGKTDWQKVDKKVNSVFTLAVLYSTLLSIAGALIVWLAVKLLRPLLWVNLANKLIVSPLKTVGVGFIAFFLIPIISLILMITIVGIPLGFILIPLHMIAIYVSKIIVAVAIGESLRQKFNWTEKHHGIWLVLMGLVILSILAFIPYLGVIVQLLMVIAGLGTIILSLARKRQNNVTLNK